MSNVKELSTTHTCQKEQIMDKRLMETGNKITCMIR